MLKEYTRPLRTPIHADENILSILQHRVQRAADQPLIEYKTAQGQWGHFTAQEFYDLVCAVAKGLMNQGIQIGDSVGIISRTRWEWTVLDLAIMSIGAVTVPVYETDSALQVREIGLDSQIRIFFAENNEQREKVDAVRADLPLVREIFTLDSDNNVSDNNVIELLTAYGKAVSDDQFRARVDAVHGDTLATIVYTSGSTGTPKGIELTHRNFVYVTYSGTQSMTELCFPEGGARLLLFLPLAHVFARYMQYFCIGSDTVLGLSHNLKTIIADFQSFKPTFILAVPRVFEKVYNAASQKAGRGYAGRLFNRAAGIACEWSVAQQDGRKLSMVKRVQFALYSKIIYSKIMEVFGGKVQFAVSGGAPLDPSIAHFFNGVGLPLLEGYGMTETCAPVCVNPTSGYKIGTVGLPMEGMTIGIADDGELCIKSESVCRGYHNHAELTDSQIIDGWLHTGDVGDIDDDGFLKITGRKKDLIITAGGKNVSPGLLESSVMTSPVVGHCVVIGDKKPFIAALITLDLADANAWLESQGAQTVLSLGEAVNNPIIHAEVQKAVDKANLQVSRAESIRKFRIIPSAFTQENGMLTASLKTKRSVIIDRFADVINHEIYTPRKKG